MLHPIDQRQKQQAEPAPSAGRGAPAPTTRDGAGGTAAAIAAERVESLIEEISRAYKQLASTRRRLSLAESARRDAETKACVEHKGALEAAKTRGQPLSSSTPSSETTSTRSS